MKRLTKIFDKFPLLIALFASIPGVLALIPRGFYGASDEVHIAWLYEMFTTLKLGQIPPRFVPDLSFRFGYPLFNFVFPLPYYIGSVFHFLGFSLVDSVKLVFFVSMPLSFFFMYKFLRKFSAPFLSFVGALIYIYTPYRSTDIYVRGAIGEILAFVFLPLILLAVNSLSEAAKTSHKRWIGIGAIAVGFLILTHNIVSYMFIPFALLYAVACSYKSRISRRNLSLFALFIVLGLLLSAYFWIPALTESGLMKYDTVFNYWDHFPTLKQLITPYFGYGASVPGNYDTMSFFIGSANLTVFILGVLVLIFRFRQIEKKDKILLVWAVFVTLIAVFMMNFRSIFVWKIVPLLPYFQFPWRFLTLTTLSTSVMVVSLKYLKKELGFLLILMVFTAFSYFRPQDFLGRQDGYYLAKYIPFPQVQPEYYTQQEEYLRLPLNTRMRPTSVRPGLYSGQPLGLQTIIKPKESRLGIEADVLTSSDVTLNYGKYYFPGWTVSDNSTKIVSYSSPPGGDVTFTLKGAGSHLVRIYFQETPFRLVFDIVSLTAFLISVYLVFAQYIAKLKFKK